MLYPLSYWSNAGIISDLRSVSSLLQVDDDAQRSPLNDAGLAGYYLTKTVASQNKLSYHSASCEK